MKKKEVKKAAGAAELKDEDPIEFIVDEGQAVSSASMLPAEEPLDVSDVAKTEEPVSDTAEAAALEEEITEEDLSPAFRELAVPKLPELTKENRAKLLLQSPNRLFFYWSLGSNPFQTLNKAFGDGTSSYTLVAKLIDLKRDIEEINPVDAEGSWWFNVEADTEYRAEVGFYACRTAHLSG